MQETPYDLVILDRMLPHMNGIEVLKEARSRQIKTPFIILTALGELNDRLTGLNCGADDYMVKPFAFEELLARIRCLLRRPAAYNPAADAVSLGDVLLYRKPATFPAAKRTVPFPAGRETLWKYFSAIPDRHFPASFFSTRVWGLDSDVEEGNLDNYIHFLRRRLKTVESSLQIKTVRGVGYQLEVFQ